MVIRSASNLTGNLLVDFIVTDLIGCGIELP